MFAENSRQKASVKSSMTETSDSRESAAAASSQPASSTSGPRSEPSFSAPSSDRSARPSLWSCAVDSSFSRANACDACASSDAASPRPPLPDDASGRPRARPPQSPFMSSSLPAAGLATGTGTGRAGRERPLSPQATPAAQAVVLVSRAETVAMGQATEPRIGDVPSVSRIHFAVFDSGQMSGCGASASSPARRDQPFAEETALEAA
mmetsp:Transcript_5392/g.17357  ORF Transcript_5392/g.17357 Transcript_5392/m.17357 type:complete len:207 (+) Transcript_5392:120-740(+)